MKTQFELDCEAIERGEYGENLQVAAQINKSADTIFGKELADEIINLIAA